MKINANSRRFSSLLAMLVFSSFQVASASSTGADFLKIPVGARATGVGQAYTALAEDVEALSWNPAGIARPNQNNFMSAGLSFSHQSLSLQNNLDHIGLIVPAGRRNSWGLSMTRLTYASQEGRGENRERTGSFDSSDTSLGLALARNMGPVIAGAQFKMIRQELGDNKASGTALDLGLLSPTFVRNLSLGLSVRNLGPKMRFISEDYQIPLTLNAGLAFRVNGPFTLLMDVQSRPYQNQVSLSMGTEFLASQAIALRAGYVAKLAEAFQGEQKSESNRGNLGGIAGMNAGLGIKVKRLNIDYAVSPFGELGLNQTFTVGMRFGEKSLDSRDDVPTAEKATPSAPAEDSNLDKNRDILILPQQEKDRWWK